MKPIRLVLVTAALASAVAACGGGTASRATSAPSPTAFVLQEWSMTAPTTQLRAGQVVVTATNRGSETHELVIVRADNAASLPTKSDGSIDEEKIPEASKPGEIADIKAGTTSTKTIDLSPGSYLAICNLVDTMGMGGMGMGGMGNGNGNGGGMTGGQMGHVHYQLGMVVAFTVA